MKTSSDKKRLGVQAGLILLASAAVGLAYNSLNPAGLNWKDASASEPAAGTSAPAGLYQVETISARLVSTGARAAPARAVNDPPAATGRRTLVTAVRTTWEKVQPLAERGEVVLVDSRPRKSYEAGHIPGAINLPEKEVLSEIPKFHAAHPPHTRLVIYCSNAKCASSSKLATALTKNYGYRDVQYVPGGYLEWLRTQNGESN